MNPSVSATFYNKLYSRGKTTGIYVAAYGFGKHGLGYDVLVIDCDTENADDRLQDYIGLRNIDRGFDYVPIGELPETKMDKYQVVLIDGGRDTSEAVTNAIAELAQYVVIPIEDQKDIRNLDSTIKALNGHPKGLVVNRLVGNVTETMKAAAKGMRLPIIGRLNNFSPAAHEIVLSGNAPHLLETDSNAAHEFASAAKSLATELKVWMNLQ